VMDMRAGAFSITECGATLPRLFGSGAVEIRSSRKRPDETR